MENISKYVEYDYNLMLWVLHYAGDMLVLQSLSRKDAIAEARKIVFDIESA